MPDGFGKATSAGRRGRRAGSRRQGGGLQQLPGADGGQQPRHAAVGHGSVGQALASAVREGRSEHRWTVAGSRGSGSPGRRRPRPWKPQWL